MTSREAAHAHIAEALGLPEWYGKNLDALADCLWEVPGDICVILMDRDAMVKSLGLYGRKIISVFEHNAERPGGCGFVICGDAEDDGDAGDAGETGGEVD